MRGGGLGREEVGVAGEGGMKNKQILFIHRGKKS